MYIAQQEDFICLASFEKESLPPFATVLPEGKRTPLLARACAQLREYFRGERRTFSLPLVCEGPPFQRKVWLALDAIPYGCTETYGSLGAKVSKRVGRSSGQYGRAVGRACATNQILIIRPCHRVLGRNGKPAGFSAGVERKLALLSLEKSVVASDNREEKDKAGGDGKQSASSAQSPSAASAALEPSSAPTPTH